MDKTKNVDEYIIRHPQWNEELILLRSIIQKTDMEETIKWGAPVYVVNNKNILGVSAFKNYVALWFFNGALLKDPYGVMINAQEGKTVAMRQWRFSDKLEINEKKILEYVKEAISNQKAGREIKPVKNAKNPVSIELLAVLKNDKSLQEAFEKLTPFKQKEYHEYIEEAKKEVTKSSRLEKIVPMILQSIGLHDKYR